MDFRLWHVVVTAVVSVVVSVLLTLGIVGIYESHRDTQSAIKAMAADLERVDKNTQVLAQMIMGRPAKGSLGISP